MVTLKSISWSFLFLGITFLTTTSLFAQDKKAQDTIGSTSYIENYKSESKGAGYSTNGWELARDSWGTQSWSWAVGAFPRGNNAQIKLETNNAPQWTLQIYNNRFKIRQGDLDLMFLDQNGIRLTRGGLQMPGSLKSNQSHVENTNSGNTHFGYQNKDNYVTRNINGQTVFRSFTPGGAYATDLVLNQTELYSAKPIRTDGALKATGNIETQGNLVILSDVASKGAKAGAEVVFKADNKGDVNMKNAIVEGRVSGATGEFGSIVTTGDGRLGIGTNEPVSNLQIKNNVGRGASFDVFNDFQALFYKSDTSQNSYGIGIEPGTFAFNTSDKYNFYRKGAVALSLDDTELYSAKPIRTHRINVINPGSGNTHFGYGNATNYISRRNDSKTVFRSYDGADYTNDLILDQDELYSAKPIRTDGTIDAAGFTINGVDLNSWNAGVRDNILFTSPGVNVGIGMQNPSIIDAPLSFDIIRNKIISLKDTENKNQHQFFGLGLSFREFRYHVPAANQNHVFYAGLDENNSTELMRIKGTGDVTVSGTVNAAGFKINGVPLSGGGGSNMWISKSLRVTQEDDTEKTVQVLSPGAASNGATGISYIAGSSETIDYYGTESHQMEFYPRVQDDGDVQVGQGAFLTLREPADLWDQDGKWAVFRANLHANSVYTHGSIDATEYLLHGQPIDFSGATVGGSQWSTHEEGGIYHEDYVTIGANRAPLVGAKLHVNGRTFVSNHLTTDNHEFNIVDPNFNQFMLWVETGVVSEDYAVDHIDDWPDYVFNKDYRLPSLEEVEDKIKKTGHLHTMPSASHIEENGFLLTDMTKRMVKTIEELTLHTIAQEKKIEKQNELIEKLAKRLDDLENKK